MTRIVTVKFQNAGRQYDFNALSIEVKPGDKVIVETDRGRAMATVVTPPREVEDAEKPEKLKNILRTATEEDLAMAASNAAREQDAYRYCQRRISERRMEMKLVRAEYAFDGSKIIFYFTADGRVDFRELVKDLAHHFHTRIEMRQIGVRDEAKQVGGLGVCGRELCCCSFLTEFNPVSVKMAKEQGLALNPSKISGQCGRLLCCLSYEYETYCEMKKGMPKCGKKVSWQGEEWQVASQNVICRKLTLRSQDGATQTVTMDQYESDEPVKADSKSTPTEEPRQERRSERRERSGSRAPQGRDRKPKQKQKSDGESKTPQAADKPMAPKPDQQGGEQNKDGARPSKRRRRGRRRPRGGRDNSGQPKQGE